MCRIRLVLLFVSATNAFNPTKMGPFDVVYDRFEECSNTGTGAIHLSLRSKRLNRTTVVADFNLTLKVPFDDALSAEFALAQFTSGGFKDNFLTQKINKVCSSSHYYAPKLIKQFLNALGVSNCPVPVGFYQVKDFSPSEDYSRKMPSFFYNKYRATSTFFKRGKTVGCYGFYFELVPKRKRKS